MRWPRTPRSRDDILRQLPVPPQAALSAGEPCREFLDLLGRYNVSIFDDTVDVRTEAGLG